MHLVQNETIDTKHFNPNIKIDSLSHTKCLYKDEFLDYN